MLPLLLVLGLVVAVAALGRSSAPSSGAKAPGQFGDGSRRVTVQAGKRYLWTVYVRPPFESDAAVDPFMTAFEAAQPKETNWEFVDLSPTRTIEGRPTNVLKFRATQVKTQAVGLPWKMLELGPTTLTVVDIEEGR